MILNNEWEFIFTSWKEQYGQQVTSRKGNTYMSVPVNSSQRKEMLEVLIQTLIDRGLTEENLKSDIIMNRIAEACAPPDYDDKSKLKKWKEAAKEDYKRVIVKVFPQEFSEKRSEDVRKSAQTESTYVKPEVDTETESGYDDMADYSYDENDEPVELKKPIDRSIFPDTMSHMPPIMSHEEFAAFLEREDNE